MPSRRECGVAVRGSGVVAVGLGLGVVPLTWSRAGLRDALGPLPATVDEVVGAAALVALSGVLVWAAAALVLSTLATVPGALGSAAGRAAAAVTPAVVRRTVAVAVGVSVAGGASPALGAVGVCATAAATPVMLSSAFASDSVSASPAASAPGTGPAKLPSLDRPAAPLVVTVAPGDSLWRIAARHLGPDATAPEIAAEWPRWYDANRAVIGPDPDLIRPRQQLQQPS